MTGPGGARHKDHLDYADSAARTSTVAQGLHHLHAAGALATGDDAGAVTWRERSPLRQR